MHSKSSSREFQSDAFYSILWLLVFMLCLIAVIALYGLWKIGHIPPPEKRPTESQLQQALWNNVKLPKYPFDKKIVPQFVFMIIAMGFKLGNFLLIGNMLQYKMDEFYLYYIYLTEIFSLYFLAVAFSAELIRWMRFEQRLASSFLQYTPEAHMKKNTLKKEGFVLYEVFLLLVFLVMAG